MKADLQTNNGLELGHLSQLDGWRGLSILCVLAAHMLPLGPKSWQLNVAVGDMGMAIFFCLSGFLITSFLLRRPQVPAFLVRRLCRILPLAYLYLVLVLPWSGMSPTGWLANFLFLQNYETQYLSDLNRHFWSLCVEVHFYLATAVAVLCAPLRWRHFIPAACLLVTGARVYLHDPASIHTHLRVDEILSGACLALIYAAAPDKTTWARRLTISPLLCGALLMASVHHGSGALQYLRPYLAAATVGATLFQPRYWLSRWLTGRVLRYLATISYALYVIHPVMMHGWFEDGSRMVKYLLKRPISFAVTWALAHLSTNYWEARWITLGKQWTSPRTATRAAEPVAEPGSVAPVATGIR